MSQIRLWRNTASSALLRQRRPVGDPPEADFTLGRLEAAAPSNFATLEPILMRDTLSNGTNWGSSLRLILGIY